MANRRPSWMDDPELIALRERALAEIENAIEPAGLHEPDPVVAEFYSGEAGRALSAARDDLAAARQRYEHAVHTARTAGFSWTEIGRILGVSRQQVHRQFRARPAN
jgi:DNA-directed RNA polymerase specialized sigma24 family protein